MQATRSWSSMQFFFGVVATGFSLSFESAKLVSTTAPLNAVNTAAVTNHRFKFDIFAPSIGPPRPTRHDRFTTSSVSKSEASPDRHEFSNSHSTVRNRGAPFIKIVKPTKSESQTITRALSARGEQAITAHQAHKTNERNL